MRNDPNGYAPNLSPTMVTKQPSMEVGTTSSGYISSRCNQETSTMKVPLALRMSLDIWVSSDVHQEVFGEE